MIRIFEERYVTSEHVGRFRARISKGVFETIEGNPLLDSVGAGKHEGLVARIYGVDGYESAIAYYLPDKKVLIIEGGFLAVYPAKTAEDIKSALETFFHPVLESMKKSGGQARKLLKSLVGLISNLSTKLTELSGGVPPILIEDVPVEVKVLGMDGVRIVSKSIVGTVTLLETSQVGLDGGLGNFARFWVELVQEDEGSSKSVVFEARVVWGPPYSINVVADAPIGSALSHCGARYSHEFSAKVDSGNEFMDVWGFVVNFVVFVIGVLQGKVGDAYLKQVCPRLFTS